MRTSQCKKKAPKHFIASCLFYLVYLTCLDSSHFVFTRGHAHWPFSIPEAIMHMFEHRRYYWEYTTHPLLWLVVGYLWKIFLLHFACPTKNKAAKRWGRRICEFMVKTTVRNHFLPESNIQNVFRHFTGRPRRKLLFNLFKFIWFLSFLWCCCGHHLTYRYWIFLMQKLLLCSYDHISSISTEKRQLTVWDNTGSGYANAACSYLQLLVSYIFRCAHDQYGIQNNILKFIWNNRSGEHKD